MSQSVYVYDGEGEFVEHCRQACETMLFDFAPTPEASTVAIAPRLTRRLLRSEYDAPAFGTLIFHPSALPYRRGPDAIRHAVASGERVSGVTWFWANEGYDAGPICEQEVVVLMPGESPGRAYHLRFVPAGVRALIRALRSIRRGTPNRFAQETGLETYDGPFVETHPVELMGP